MPDRVKEKLVELLDEATEKLKELCGGLNNHDGNGVRADHLIANGVTLQGEKHHPDLTGKCGSCAWAKPAGEGYTARRVRCEIKENIGRMTNCKTAAILWRSSRACKHYKPLPELSKGDL